MKHIMKVNLLCTLLVSSALSAQASNVHSKMDEMEYIIMSSLDVKKDNRKPVAEAVNKYIKMVSAKNGGDVLKSLLKGVSQGIPENNDEVTSRLVAGINSGQEEVETIETSVVLGANLDEMIESILMSDEIDHAIVAVEIIKESSNIIPEVASGEDNDKYYRAYSSYNNIADREEIDINPAISVRFSNNSDIEEDEKEIVIAKIDKKKNIDPTKSQKNIVSGEKEIMEFTADEMEILSQNIQQEERIIKITTSTTGNSPKIISAWNSKLNNHYQSCKMETSAIINTGTSQKNKSNNTDFAALSSGLTDSYMTDAITNNQLLGTQEKIEISAVNQSQPTLIIPNDTAKRARIVVEPPEPRNKSEDPEGFADMIGNKMKDAKDAVFENIERNPFSPYIWDTPPQAFDSSTKGVNVEDIFKPLTSDRLHEYRVIGVVISQAKSIAVVQSRNFKDFFVESGDRIGKEGGRVSSIEVEGIEVTVNNKTTRFLPVSNKIKVQKDEDK